MKAGVVFDCMIFLQAAASDRGPAAACVARAEGAAVTLYLSPEIDAEIRDVLGRPGVQKKFRTLTAERVAEFLARLERVAVMIPDVPTAFELTRDPKDSKYLNLAIAANAELVVSRDKDLLDLMTSDDEEPVAFRTAYPDIRIVDPVTFLRSFPPENAPNTDSPDEAP